jgi:SAM-dependent methyltransferase
MSNEAASTLSEREFSEDFERFLIQESYTKSRFRLNWNERKPILDERVKNTPFPSQYIYHTAWAARVLYRSRPKRHVDISSQLWFATMVSTFVPVEYFDYRPPLVQLDNLKVGFANLSALPFPDASVESLSCMHVVEHVGLGRYGDPLDYDGDLKAMAELKRVLAPGGQLLFVVPLSEPRIEFNAHRYYHPDQILEAFAGFNLEEFGLIFDDETFWVFRSPVINFRQQRDGCGCFLLRKPLKWD